MDNPSTPNGTSSHDDSSDSSELMRRQAMALERLALVSDPEYIPRARALKRLAGLIVALSGGVLAAYEFAIFVYESHQRRDMVSNWVEAARELYEVESSPDEAVVMLERASDLSPQDASVVKMSAYIGGMRTVEQLMNLDRPFSPKDMEDYGQAMGQAIMLERVDKDNPEWAILRGQLALAAGETDRARSFIAKALQIDPASPFANLRLALVHMNLSREAAGADDSATRDAEMAKCRQLIDRSLALNPDFSLAKLWKALIALSDGDLDTTITMCRQILQKDPRFYKALATLGEAYTMQAVADGASEAQSREAYAKAQDAYERALAIKPDLSQGLYGLARLYGLQDKYEIGLRYARSATAMDPGSLAATQMQGTLAIELAKVGGPDSEDYGSLIEEAIGCYSKALDLNPRDADNYIERSKLYRQTGKLRLAGADARNAVLFAATDPYAHNVLGLYLLDAGFLEEAASAFATCTQLDEKFDAGYLGRGRALRALGNLEEAEASLDAALDVASADLKSQMLLERGRVREARGNAEGALADFVAARTDDPDSFDAWIAEANALRALNRKDASVAAARSALQLRPDDQVAKQLMSGQ